MEHTTHAEVRRHPLHVLVWCSWACVVWFALGWAILKAPISVASFLEIGALLSGGVVGLGSLLALGYLIFVARDRSAILNGIASLIANATLFAFFVRSLP
jgi:hypothetical protein